MPDEARTDEAYEWTVRLLYLVLIAGNLIIVWDSVKDTPIADQWRARVAQWRERLSNCEGCARRREWLNRQAGRMLWDATQTLEVGPDWDREGNP